MKKHKTGFLFAIYERGQCTRKKPLDPDNLWTKTPIRSIELLIN